MRGCHVALTWRPHHASGWRRSGVLVTGATCHDDDRSGYQNDEELKANLVRTLAAEGRDEVTDSEEKSGGEMRLLAAMEFRRVSSEGEESTVKNMRW